MYIATQLTPGRRGRRHLMTKITFNKGGVWQPVVAPKVDNKGKLLNCSLVSCVDNSEKVKNTPSLMPRMIL